MCHMKADILGITLISYLEMRLVIELNQKNPASFRVWMINQDEIVTEWSDNSSRSSVDIESIYVILKASMAFSGFGFWMW